LPTFDLGVMVWHSGSMLLLINELNQHQARLVLGCVTMSASVAGHLSRYVTSHPGQLSLPSLRGQ